MANTGLSVAFTAELSGLSKGAADAAALVGGATREMQRDFQSFSKEGESAFERLEKSAKQYKRGQVQEGRLLGFYLKEMNEFVPVSKEAAAGLSGLAQAGMAFAGGSILGGVFELAKVGAEGVRKLAEFAKSEIEKLNEAVALAVSKAKQAQGDQAEQDYQKTIAGPLKAYQELRERIEKADEARRKTMERPGESDVDKKRLQEASDLQGRYLDEQKAKYDKLRAAALATRDAERAALHITDLSKRNGPDVEFKGDLAATDGGSGSAAKKATDAALAARRQYYEGVSISYQMEFEAYRKMRLAEMALDDDKAKQAWEMLQKEREEGEALYQESLRRQKDEALALRQNAKEWQNYGSQVGAIMQGVGDAIGGQASNMAGLFAKMIQQAIQLAVALSATAGPFGWLNAAAAAATLLGTVASIPRMSSASGGWDTPSSGGPFPTLLHPNEKVLDASRNAKLDRLLNSGSTGGAAATAHLHFHGPTDANSVRAFLRSPAWQREWNAATRDGRI